MLAQVNFKDPLFRNISEPLLEWPVVQRKIQILSQSTERRHP